MLHNKLKVCHLGFSGIDSEVGPIVAFCLVLKIPVNKKFSEWVNKLSKEENYLFDEKKFSENFVSFSSGMCLPKSKENNQIQRAINAAASQAVIDIKLVEGDKTFRPEVIVSTRKDLKIPLNIQMNFVSGYLFGSLVCEMLAERIRRRYIEGMCEMMPILKVWHINENYGMLDKKHKKVIKENGKSDFHRKDLFIDEKQNRDL